MKYNKLEYFVSQPRMERFLKATHNSKSKAQQLYRINLRVSQAFYPLLNLFEIFLRNSINHQISSYFKDPEWITTQKNGFMNDKKLHKSKFFIKNSVIKAEKTITKKGGKISPGKVIAEQSFGFWTSLFERHHYKLIGGVVIHSFPNKPSKANRSLIAQKLNKIRGFRNRIYHNEPICFSGDHIDFSNAENILTEINQLLNWMDPDLVEYCDYFNNITSKIKSAKNI